MRLCSLILARVVSCKFINNRHGVISISDMANVTLKDCYFEIEHANGTAIQVFAYPKSLLKILGNNTLNIIKLNNAKTIFIHLPSNKLANLNNVLWQCGNGWNFKVYLSSGI